MIDGVTPEPVQDWDGKERREIPFHLVNYMNDKLAQHAQDTRQILADHAQEEMARYSEMLNSIDHVREANERRYDALASAIGAYTEKVDEFYKSVEQAFPRTEDGKADFSGHAKAHKAWMASSEDNKELMEYVRQQRESDKRWKEDGRFVMRAVVVAVLAAVVMWAGNTLWSGAVKVGMKEQTAEGKTR